MIDVKENVPFDEALSRFSRPIVQRQKFMSQHYEPELFYDYDFPPPERSVYQYLTYDVAMALGIAACECKADLFTGEELYQQFLKTELEGSSGHVAFSLEPGTRL